MANINGAIINIDSEDRYTHWGDSSSYVRSLRKLWTIIYLLVLLDIISTTILCFVSGDEEGEEEYIKDSVLKYKFTNSLFDVVVLVLIRSACVVYFSFRQQHKHTTAVPIVVCSVAAVFLVVKVVIALVVAAADKHTNSIKKSPTAITLLVLALVFSCLEVACLWIISRQPPAGYSALQTDARRSSEKQPTKKKSHANVFRLVKLAKPEFPLLSAAMLMLFIASLTSLAMPAYFGKLLQAVTTTHSLAELNSAVVALLIIFSVGSVAAFLRAWWFNWAGQRLVARLRKDLFHCIIIQEIAFFDENKTGELTSRLASDTQVLQDTLTVNISMLVRYTVQVVGAIVLLFVTSWSLTLIMLASVPFVAVSAVIFGKKIKALRKDFQDALGKAAATGEEAISSIRTVRSFAQEERLHAKYSNDIHDSYTIGKKTAILSGTFNGAVSMLSQSAIVLVVYIGAKQVLQGKITTGALTSFLLYTITVAFSFAFISSLFGDFMSAVGASERIFELIDRTPKISSGGKEIIPSVRGELVIDNVTFKYPSRPEKDVLSGVSLCIQPGNIVALVGPSGGGKSTIVSLIERFYDPDSGRITLDGVDVRSLDPKWYRAQIGFVSQEPVLFSCSIRENIAFGSTSATLQQIEEAAVEANAHQFIDGFSEKYDTLVGERGVRLSGGQRQRLAIARALLLNPQILLLDEATSALDAESEFLVQQAIERLMRNRTVIVIAHRLSTVRNANQVAVVADGRIVEMGTHNELMESKEGIYRKLVKRQLQTN